jgi:mannitol/fructose-specific phosphotransferase system IIA component (Ntr-type)
MNLLDILSSECVKAPLEGADKRAVINELVDVLAAAGRVQDADALKEAVWTREQTRTTGIGHGLAIPHGKSAGMASLAMAIGKPADPWTSRPSTASRSTWSSSWPPPDRTSDHIQALARISRLMTMDDFRESIYRAQSAAEIWELLEQEETAR